MMSKSIFPDAARRLPVFLLSFLSLAFLAAAFPTAAADPGEIRSLAKRYRSMVKTLSSARMEGRGLDTDGIVRAADWIEARLVDIGLEPAFAEGYRQPFPVKIGVELIEGNRLDGVAGEDWTPLAFSSPGEFDGDLVFAGYGIEAPEIGYRELEGLDLHGKVVLMLRYEPQEKDEGSPFRGRKPSRWSGMRYKVLQARERGAAAVIFANGPLQDEGRDTLPVLRNDGPKSPAGIPVLQVRTSVARRWLGRIGIDLTEYQESIDRDLLPRPVVDTGTRLAGNAALEPIYTEAENIAGLIPGRGALAGEWITVGAHYDHLGYGGKGSMRPNVTEIHNGADDNASGVAAILLVAESMRESLAEVKNHRTVVFALFSAEEVGLAGSSRFVEAPPFPIERDVAMVNLDMVGRLRDETLVALGTDSAVEWASIVEPAAAGIDGIEVVGHGDGYGPSDHTSFYASGVPVLHLFTGGHEQHHTPEDEVGLINAEGAVRVARFTEEVVLDLAGRTGRLTYRRSSEGPAMAGDSRGYGAYLGTVPDYRAMEAAEGGVLLSDVRPGGPADRAGIRAGDRIVAMAGTKIENLYDMTYALQDHKPGQTIEVVVMREDAEVRLMATLGDRNRRRDGQAPAGRGGVGGEKTADPGAAHAAPHPDAPPPAAEKPAVAPFYENRPGPDLRIGAGEPFGRSFDGEGHLADVRQLTFEGENAEAYFHPDGRRLIFQATTADTGCDQQFVLDLETGETTRVSTGRGRTTCGYYDWPEADRILYSSTQAAGAECPPPPDYSMGYVWALYDDYDIYEAAPDGSGARRLTTEPGYDAETTWCHRGGKFVFTSIRDGDLDLYVMNEAGDVERLTDVPGYDGGAFFSPDCSEIVWRASRPEGKDLDDYRRLLEKNLVRPGRLEIFVMNADGSDVRQLTDNGAANFCPTFTADGSRIIYASNAGSDTGREFDLWLIDKEGGEPERITTSPGFDGFPQFSPDGRYLVWSSNRADPESRVTNLFIARWVE